MKKIYVPNCKVREFEEDVKRIIDVREGVVMDSFIGILKNNKMFVALDTYETSRTSGLTVYTGGSNLEIYDIWDEFTAAYDKEYPTEE